MKKLLYIILLLPMLAFGQTINITNTGSAVQIQSQNLIVNGDFSAWSGAANPNNVPTGWTVANNNATNYVEDATNACRFISDGTNIQLFQDILTVGKRYRASINVTDVTAGQIRLYNNTTLLEISSTGIKTVDFTAGATTLYVLKLVTPCDITFTNVKVSEYFPVQMGN